MAAPGPLATGFLDRSGLKELDAIKLYPMMSAELAAEAIYEGYTAGNGTVYPGFLAAMAAVGAKLLPQSLLSRLAAWIVGKPTEDTKPC